MSKPPGKRRGRSLVIGLLAAIPIIAAYLHWQSPPLQICRAVDGDTIHCGEQRVRLVGLDAPEMRGRCEAERQLAGAAKERLHLLLAGGVRLEEAGQDRFGRVLAVVRDTRGDDVAQVLIREGLARAYHGRGAREGWC